ncbi:MAG: SDR family NAD(P)-dependent oxidoreductase [Alphaproteobacteria bacterium]
MLAPAGRVAMVSGANRGLGLAIAEKLYADGYSLSLGARDPVALARIHVEMDRTRVLFARYDAAALDSCRTWVAATAARFGRIDALVNNAGLLHQFTVAQADEAALDEMWQVNAKAPLFLAKAALTHLRLSGSGRIVNVSSLSGLRVRRTDFVGYSMTKFALIALSHALRQEAWADGVRVCAFCPSVMATDMAKGMGIDPTSLIDPRTAASMIATVLALPNSASVAELPVNIFAEPTW